jgi:transmembrane protein TMEM174 (potassium channel)
MAIGLRESRAAERGRGLSDSKERAAGSIPRSRLDSLTDGVFAFAMTLLVINIELPEGFHPATNREFLAKLSGLSDTFTAYLITFFVLIGFWSGRAQEETGEAEMASRPTRGRRSCICSASPSCRSRCWR